MVSPVDQEADLLTQSILDLATRFDKAAEEERETPSDWLEKHYYIPTPRDPVTGMELPSGPIRLADHQRRIINEALSRDKNGLYNYSTVIYSAPKKSGKSAIASAVALYMAAITPFGQIYCLANDGKNSKDRLYLPIWRCLNFHRQRGLTYKDARINITEAFLGNNAHIEAIPCDASGEAGSEPTGVFYSEFWGYIEENKKRLFCYDEETEILTRRGWLKYTELSTEDEIATLNPRTKTLEWQVPTAVHIFDHRGEVYVADARDTSIVVTKGHRFFGSVSTDSQTDRIRLVEDIAELSQFGIRASTDLPQKGRVPFTAVSVDGTEHLPELTIPLIPFLGLLGWYISEGWVDKKSSGYPVRVCIAQKDKLYRPAIESIINSCGLPFTLSKDGYRINDVRLAKYFSQFGLSYDKYLPSWVKELPPEYLWHFLTAYHGGDGGKTETTWTYFTTSKQLRDDLTEIGVRLGARVNVQTYSKKKEHHHDKYRIVFSYSAKHKYLKKHHWSKQPYSGKVWCPSVPNGIVMVRRKDSYYFGGNTEMTLPPTLYGKAIRWIESYAGFVGVSDLLMDMYTVGVKDGEPHPDFLDLLDDEGNPVVYVNRQAHMFAYWDTVPRMIWQTPEYYQQEAKILSPSEFQRIHRNKWVSPVGGFIHPEWWDACADPLLPPLLPGSDVPVVLGVDAAISGDCAAIVGVTRDPRLPETEVAVRFCYIFKPSPNRVIQIEKDLGRMIRHLNKNFNVVCIAYDAYQMEGLVQNYRRGEVTLAPDEIEGMSPEEALAYLKEEQAAAQRWYYKFGQQSPRAIADKRLYDMIVARQVHWNPDDRNSAVAPNGNEESLTKHIKQAGSKQDESKMRIEKLAADAKIDAAVATSMAVQRCMTLNLDNRELHAEELTKLLQAGKINYIEFQQRLQAARDLARIDGN